MYIKNNDGDDEERPGALQQRKVPGGPLLLLLCADVPAGHCCALLLHHLLHGCCGLINWIARARHVGDLTFRKFDFCLVPLLFFSPAPLPGRAFSYRFLTEKRVTHGAEPGDGRIITSPYQAAQLFLCLLILLHRRLRCVNPLNREPKVLQVISGAKLDRGKNNRTPRCT